MGCPEGVRAPGSQAGCYLVCKILSLPTSKDLVSRNRLCSDTSASFLLMSRSEHYPEMHEQLCPAAMEVSGARGSRCAVRARMGSLECFGTVLLAKLLCAHGV